MWEGSSRSGVLYKRELQLSICTQPRFPHCWSRVTEGFTRPEGFTRRRCRHDGQCPLRPQAETDPSLLKLLLSGILTWPRRKQLIQLSAAKPRSLHEDTLSRLGLTMTSPEPPRRTRETCWLQTGLWTYGHRAGRGQSLGSETKRRD